MSCLVKYLPILVILFSCSSVEFIQLDDSALYSWVNLMPGSEPTFNLKGKLKINEKCAREIDKIIVFVNQDKYNLYQAKSEYWMISEFEIEFKINPQKLQNNIDLNKIVDVIIVVYSKNGNQQKFIKISKMEKAY